MTEPHEAWLEQCMAAVEVERDFGTQNALDYLVGEKFLNFLEAAETDAAFRDQLPAFVIRIKLSSNAGNWSNIWQTRYKPNRFVRTIWMISCRTGRDRRHATR